MFKIEPQDARVNQIFVIGQLNEAPYSAAEIREGLRTGVFRPDQLAFVDPGEKGPLEEVLLKVEALPHYAKFMQRFWAVLIDSALLWTAQVVGAILLNRYFSVNIIAHLSRITSGLSYSDVAFIVYNVFCIAVDIAYFAIFESSSSQATLGKMALGIKVTDSNGNRISFKQGLNRATDRMVSYALGNIGFLMALVDESCITLHDAGCQTLVLNSHSGYHLTRTIPNPPYGDIRPVRADILAYNIDSHMTFLGRSGFILLSLLFYFLALFTNTIEVVPSQALPGITALLVGWVPFGTQPFAFGTVAWTANLGYFLALLLLGVGLYERVGKVSIGSLSIACFTFTITGVGNGSETSPGYNHAVGFGPGVLLWFLSLAVPLVGAICLGVLLKIAGKKAPASV